MAELDFAFLADYARIKAKSMDALSIGIDTIIVPTLPTKHQVFLAVRLAFERQDCGVPYRVEAFVQNTDGKRLAEVRIDGQAVWPDPDPPGDRSNAQAVIPLQLPLESPGPHSVDLVLDDRPLKSIIFLVLTDS